MDYIVCAFYHFTLLNDLPILQAKLRSIMDENTLKGTILIAPEGINGTVSGAAESMAQLIAWLHQDPRFATLKIKESLYHKAPFYRAQVRVKKEIITMGVGDLNPKINAGTYIEPEKWDDFIDSEDVIIVDTRNDYEIAIGSFKGAMNPKTQSFRAFPDFVKQNLGAMKQKKIAMFCTGGIRCEKSTAYLKSQGFENVYHLQGGILKYLETVNAEKKQNSAWQGECFVFDQRVAVTHNLQKGTYDQCYACRMPITANDKLSEFYVLGVSCHHCYHQSTKTRKQGWSERQKQITLARARGHEHMGTDPKQFSRKNQS